MSAILLRRGAAIAGHLLDVKLIILSFVYWKTSVDWYKEKGDRAQGEEGDCWWAIGEN
jgi:hypothetical protein